MSILECKNLDLNRFTHRGISIKTGKFVFGYHVKSGNEGKHYITKTDSFFTVCGVHKSHLEEITKEPDQCLGIKDVNGNWLHENDECFIREDFESEGYSEKAVIKWNSRQCFFLEGCRDSSVFFSSFPFYEIEDDELIIEITGNTHGIEND